MPLTVNATQHEIMYYEEGMKNNTNTTPLLQHFKPPQQETSLMRPSTGYIPTGAWRRAHLAPINRVQNKIVYVLNLLSPLQMMTKQFRCVEIHVTVTRKST